MQIVIKLSRLSRLCDACRQIGKCVAIWRWMSPELHTCRQMAMSVAVARYRRHKNLSTAMASPWHEGSRQVATARPNDCRHIMIPPSSDDPPPPREIHSPPIPHTACIPNPQLLYIPNWGSVENHWSSSTPRPYGCCLTRRPKGRMYVGFASYRG